MKGPCCQQAKRPQPGDKVVTEAHVLDLEKTNQALRSVAVSTLPLACTSEDHELVELLCSTSHHALDNCISLPA